MSIKMAGSQAIRFGRSSGSPSEIMEAEARKTKRMAVAGVGRARRTGAGTILPCVCLARSEEWVLSGVAQDAGIQAQLHFRYIFRYSKLLFLRRVTFIFLASSLSST